MTVYGGLTVVALVAVFYCPSEPNAFYHLVKFRLEPEQLARDYATMKRILSGYKQFDNCLILGPSVTQLNKKWTDEFFQRYPVSIQYSQTCLKVKGV